MGFRRSVFPEVCGALNGTGARGEGCVVVVVHFAAGLACFTTGLEHGNKDSTSKFSTGFLTSFLFFCDVYYGSEAPANLLPDGSSGFLFNAKRALHPAIL